SRRRRDTVIPLEFADAGPGAGAKLERPTLGPVVERNARAIECCQRIGAELVVEADLHELHLRVEACSIPAEYAWEAEVRRRLRCDDVGRAEAEVFVFDLHRQTLG